MLFTDRVLCVDDEPFVLEGLQRTLRRSFNVTTAVGPEAAIRVLTREGPFGAIVSDLNMPGMDGVEFLEASRQLTPHSARILLTGKGDLTTAISAINRGEIFRFLLKPCAPDVLINALSEGLQQYTERMRARTSAHTVAPAVAQGRPTVPEPLGGDLSPGSIDPLMKFLVVDRSPMMRRITINSLQRMGYSEIIESTNGEEALQAFGPSIRCVITDWDLPQLSGLEVIRTLRGRPDGRDVPILMMTARSTRDDVQAAHSAGASTYLLRPFTLEAFKQKLEAALRPSR